MEDQGTCHIGSAGLHPHKPVEIRPGCEGLEARVVPSGDTQYWTLEEPLLRSNHGCMRGCARWRLANKRRNCEMLDNGREKGNRVGGFKKILPLGLIMAGKYLRDEVRRNEGE